MKGHHSAALIYSFLETSPKKARRHPIRTNDKSIQHFSRDTSIQSTQDLGMEASEEDPCVVDYCY